MTQEYESRFLTARKNYIRNCFAGLNDMQQQAVMTTEGPLLLLAGAGSGKTTVLINRIANLIRFGSGSDSNTVPWNVTEADVEFLEHFPQQPDPEDIARADALCGENPAAPWNIIAITFTNKAANELKERLARMLGPQAMDVWAMTFHSACCRILRRDAELLGYTRSFTIYDSADSERVMKDIIRDMGLDDKSFPAKLVLNQISRQKDAMITPDECAEEARLNNDLRLTHVAKCYKRYQNQLKENNAVDFDDIIYLTVKLLREHEDVRRYYQRKFRYVLVDEYQDTNNMQYLLTSLLAGGRENICVVGDDDQSIYRFRGATIENILSFEKQYKGTRTIRLEQNYRSTQAILNAANAVISNNIGRKGKRLWTANGQGEKVISYESFNEGEEANYVAARILALSKKGRGFKNSAVLYRTNAQSNALEYAFKRNGIPYRIIGGTRFFDRAEVKDMLAYLCVINNRNDDLRLMRIVNTPARGLGAKALETTQRLARAEGKPLYHVLSHPKDYAPLEKNVKKMNAFTELIESLAELLDSGITLGDFYEEVMNRTGYVEMLQNKPTEENKTRLENVRELKSSINNYAQNSENPTLAGFLEEIALYTDIEQYDPDADAAVMMTIHSAKGLEFDHVFLVGFEDGLFPSMRSIGDHEEMEEERRLCYVAITRAKKTLDITNARQRMLYGQNKAALHSRFLDEIPENCLIKKGRRESRESGYQSSYREGGYDRCSYGDYGDYGYQPRTQAPKKQILNTSAPAKPKVAMLDLNKGDMVRHKVFGKGMVLSVTHTGGDALLEIAFDEVGTKHLMCKTASAYMTKE